MINMEFICDQIVLSIFVLSVSLTYIWCFIIFRRMLSGKPMVLDPKSIFILVVGAVGIVCMVYGLVEPFHLETTKEKFKSIKLKKSDENLRILHISDLHCDGLKRVVDRIPSRIVDLKPDFVVFTGDACNNEKGLKDFRSCITEIAKICPVYAVKGNHDTRGGRYWDHFNGTGVIELNCSSKTTSVRDIQVWIGGVAVDSEACMKELLNEAPKDAFTIFLYHYPTGGFSASKSRIDLVCTGHTHGGQVRLPFYGALITATGISRRYDRGLFDIENTKMHISQGTGMTGVPIRFLTPPQITLIEVEPNEVEN